jgi:1-acyl-sn-glycerol-3-phosphate acyltransferase
VQLQGSALARKIFEALGWSIRFEGLPAKQGVMVVYPHTSNWDFVYLVMAKWTVGMQLRFWAKDSLFRLPLMGRWMRWLGGVPVNRGAPNGIVGQTVRTLQKTKEQDGYFWLALTPEGTRKWTPGWRSGFYQVARGADVPVGICSVNYREKRVYVSNFYHLSGDAKADMARIAQGFHGAAGKNHAQAAPIQLIEK